MLCCRQRPSNIDASEGALEELVRIVAQIRDAWPEVRILVRGDSGFCREAIMAWCEANAVDYVFGVARDARLVRKIARQMRRSRRRCVTTGRFRDFRHQTLTSWSRSRRVVSKAEVLPGLRGANPRFVVTSLSVREIGARALYENLYCARGDMENRIKEQQLDLFADRTLTATMWANQLRLYFSAVAGILLQTVRSVGLAGTALSRAQYGTIRARLLKVACQLRLSVRRVRLALSSVHPRQYLFGHVALALRRAAAADPAPHRSHRALAGPASAELCLKPLPTADDSVLFSRLAVRGSLKCCRRGTYPRNPRRKPKNAARFNARRCNRRLGELSGLELSLV